MDPLSLAKVILNALLDRFENSLQAWVEQTPSEKRARKISLKVNKGNPLFGKYWVEDSYLYRPDYDEAVSSLEKRGFVYSRRDLASGLLIEIVLLTENVDAAFSYLGRTRKKEENLFDLRYLQTLLAGFPLESVPYAYLQSIIDEVANRKPLSQFCHSRKDLEETLSMIESVSNQQEDILLRNFSKRNFGDSKAFERKSSKILSIFKRFGKGQQPKDFKELCENHHILKNPEAILLKGKMTIQIGKQNIDLGNLNMPFSVMGKGLKEMDIACLSAKRIITIENLTTFHYFEDPCALLIYLGGYHGSAASVLLSKLKDIAKPETEWLHFGDIDWGGFNILLNLRRKTGIPFKPFLMGITELEKYKDECKTLSAQDRKNLISLGESKDAFEFTDVIDYMLEHDIKLEQESIEFESH